MSFIDPAVIKPFNVVLDAGSGMAGLVAPTLFDRLPVQGRRRLCFEIDGTFPNHEANPLIEENRRDITAEVIRQKADIGIAWDGDADRCFFIDGSGEFISGDFITALLAEAFLLKHPGATVIYDLRASHAVKDTSARYGGRALMNRVGHAFIKQRMRQEDGIFAGEVTGHYYFRDFYYADNGFIPALLILELMSKKNQSLRDLLQPYRERYFISGEINTKLAQHGRGAARSWRRSRRATRTPSSRRMDGVSVDYPDWHFNVRASNTEPLLRLNLEAATPELMETEARRGAGDDSRLRRTRDQRARSAPRLCQRAPNETKPRRRVQSALTEAIGESYRGQRLSPSRPTRWIKTLAHAITLFALDDEHLCNRPLIQAPPCEAGAGDHSRSRQRLNASRSASVPRTLSAGRGDPRTRP